MDDSNQDKFKYQQNSLKWLFEMELITNPQALNNIKLNIFLVSKFIKDIQMLVDTEKKSMLIYVKLSWWGKKFYKKQIITDIYSMIEQLVPNYRFRITEDFDLLNKALTLVADSKKTKSDKI